MDNPGEHIEQAEQAQEAIAHPFNKRVTLSIAMVAAVLATVSMFGQNADNDALLNQGDALDIKNEALGIQNEALAIQGEALRMQTLATLKSDEASNKWAQYQANNIRGHMYNAFADLAETQPGSEKAAAKVKFWRDKFDDYENKRLPKMKEEAEKLTASSQHYMHQAAALLEKAQAKQKEAEEKRKESEEKRKESEIAQGKGDRFDYGELGLQLGVVLCSLAILTRSKGFWGAGLLCSAAGIVAGLSGYFGWWME